jgi:EpsD family peptidyl-prolyl cis-trans isomerase
MNSNAKLAAAVVACAVAVAGCSGHKEPTGQVAATVDGKEVTVIDLKNELNGFSSPDPKVQKAAEAKALDSVLARKVLAAAARKAKIDKSPEYIQQKDRVDDTLLIQTWQKKLIDSVPAPNREEVDQFISAHPDLYANRKLMLVDQIRFPRVDDPAFLEKLKAVNTMEELTQLLTQNNIPFQTANDTIDPLGIDPNALSQVEKLPPGEIFIVPTGNVLIANKIASTKDAPVSGDLAVKHATQLIRTQRAREAVQKQFGGVLAQAKPKIRYNKAYQPAAQPAAKPAPAAAPAKAS